MYICLCNAITDRAIADVGARGKPTIVCGGTGLYVRALLQGLFEGPPASAELRAELGKDLPPGGLAAVLSAYQAEGRRLVAEDASLAHHVADRRGGS